MVNAANCIVGGGIVGLLAAWYLTNEGRSVVVVESGSQDLQGASWAAGGILSPLHPGKSAGLEPIVRMSQAEYPSLVRQLESETEVAIELQKTRLILLNGNALTTPGALGNSVELRAIEPALCAHHSATIYDTYHLRSPRLLRALKLALARRGVCFLDRQVRAFVPEKHGIGILTVEGDSIYARACLVAAGAWTDLLLRSTGLDICVKPIRGQMLAIRAVPSTVRNVIVFRHQYLVPRMDGLVLVGSTAEDVGFERGITEVARKDLRDFAIDLVPELGKYEIEHHWAGLRPGSPDDLPFIGEHPDIKGLFVCAGHFRNGFATGPATARLAVDIMLGSKPSIDPWPYRLNRPCPQWGR